jgi:hypothetical protein
LPKLRKEALLNFRQIPKTNCWVEEVELEVRDGAIVISPGEQPRRGWAEAAQALAAEGGDRLLDEPLPTEFDATEWEW